ncbi:MAG: hypothetical protein HQM11_14360 [SAR324 cluster bacterium]|nr:hypothetical protein [SAR324 cluster bacterium]
MDHLPMRNKYPRRYSFINRYSETSTHREAGSYYQKDPLRYIRIQYGNETLQCRLQFSSWILLTGKSRGTIIFSPDFRCF